MRTNLHVLQLSLGVFKPALGKPIRHGNDVLHPSVPTFRIVRLCVVRPGQPVCPVQRCEIQWYGLSV